jgi:hypothetical protein
MQPRMIMHPYRPDLEGTDISTFADPAGKRLFVACVEIVRASGAGYVDYQWQWMDDPTRIVPKISYVMGFRPVGMDHRHRHLRGGRSRPDFGHHAQNHPHLQLDSF